MRIAILTLAVAISLAVFACSESPSSPADGSSSSVVLSSSSGGEVSFMGRACEYSSEEFGLSEVFSCADIPSDMPNLQEHEAECKSDGGTWVSACPSGEKATCIDEEDPYEKVILYKFYSDGFVCSDLLLKNADGSEDNVSKGGACFISRSSKFSMCAEFPELPTSIIKLSCAEMGAPFVNECSKADLTCYDPNAIEPEKKMISHFYGEAMSSLTCEDFDMEELP